MRRQPVGWRRRRSGAEREPGRAKPQLKTGETFQPN